MNGNDCRIKLVNKEPFTYDIERLRFEAFAIIKEHNYLLDREAKQLMLTCRSDSKDPSFEGTGKLIIPEGKTPDEVQKEFNCFNPAYVGTELEKVWQTFPFPIGRVRLILLRPHCCYSAHTDGQWRYHIALRTNSQCFFFFRGDAEWYQIPDDSHLYSFNALVEHTAINGGDKSRLHIVFDAIHK